MECSYFRHKYDRKYKITCDALNLHRNHCETNYYAENKQPKCFVISHCHMLFVMHYASFRRRVDLARVAAGWVLWPGFLAARPVAGVRVTPSVDVITVAAAGGCSRR